MLKIKAICNGCGQTMIEYTVADGEVTEVDGNDLCDTCTEKLNEIAKQECSFCGKIRVEMENEMLIAGTNAFICHECTKTCLKKFEE